jgi:predicted RNase H-like HicB family nuclease
LHKSGIIYTNNKKEEKVVENRFTAVFQQDGDWWLGWVEELPGANTQGRTLEEARENLREAVALIIEANRKLAQNEIEGKEVIREEFLITT